MNDPADASGCFAEPVSVRRASSAWAVHLAGSGRWSAIYLIGFFLGLKLAILFAFAWNSRFVMDEFVQLGWSKYINNGLFETVWPGKAVGYAVFYKLAHLIGWNATSILLIGRVQTAVLACATLVMIYACARTLGEGRLRSFVILLLLLSFSNFIERVFRTIAEPLAVFFAVGALLVVLHRRADRPLTILAAGILCGLSFLTTQKAVYFDVALGVALIADAAIARRLRAAINRGAWLVLGWIIPVAGYCVLFGGTDPVPVARNLLFGPTAVVSSSIAAEYGGLRQYVLQTLLRNLVLYAFCFAGMIMELWRIGRLDERRRIALVFSVVITVLVFAHNQPWPYVFIMALPFMSLWALVPLDRIASEPKYVRLAVLALAFSVLVSLVRNLQYLQIDNSRQLALVARAESTLHPGEVYFDGIGMVPNGPEPSTLWLDRHYVLKTLSEGPRSDAYRIFAERPPKIILWSYRMTAIDPVVGSLIRDSYVQVAPNLRVAGRRLVRGEPTTFKVPLAARYALYAEDGRAVQAQVEVNGFRSFGPFDLDRGSTRIVLVSGPEGAFLLPQGSYERAIRPGSDDKSLFDRVYD